MEFQPISAGNGCSGSGLVRVLKLHCINDGRKTEEYNTPAVEVIKKEATKQENCH